MTTEPSAPIATIAVPAYAGDLFTDGAILDPYPHYTALREIGPVVHLTAHGVYALTRYDAVRAALARPDVLISGEGTGLNDAINTVARETTLNSDGALHDHLRSVLSRDLAPKSLRSQEPHVQALADRVVAALVDRGSFDAVSDLAHVLPLTVVPDLLGWPEEARPRLVDFGSAVFDAFGPDGPRSAAAFPLVGEVFAYTAELAGKRDLPPGSIGAGILAAEEAGEITATQCPMLLADLLAPSLDTTISAIGSAIWLFGTHPDQWDIVRADPGLIPSALNEVLRLETPIRVFTRLAREDWVVEDSVIERWVVPAGHRVAVLYGSANRDHRHFPDPDAFDVTRNPTDHLGFGYGVHGCVGQGLARLEIHALLRSLAGTVARFDIGEPTTQVNNLIRARSALPVTVRPA